MKNKIKAVMDQHPDLNYFGCGLRLNTSGGDLRMEPATDQDRQLLLRATGQVARAVQWLSGAGKRKTINKRIDSYGLKHLFERSTGHQYLSNGALICSALICGFKFDVSDGGPNVFLNISQKFINQQDARADAAGWRP